MEVTIIGPDFILVDKTASYQYQLSESGIAWYGWSLDGTAATMSDGTKSSTEYFAELLGQSVGSVRLTSEMDDVRKYPWTKVWGNKTIQIIQVTISGPTSLPRGGQGTYTATVEGADPADLVFEWYGDFQNTVRESQSGAQCTINVTDSQFNGLFGNTGTVWARIKQSSDMTELGDVYFTVEITDN